MWNIDRMLSVPIEMPSPRRTALSPPRALPPSRETATVVPFEVEPQSSIGPLAPVVRSASVMRRRRERLAKVPVPLDQRIVQGPLRDPQGTIFDDEVDVGSIRMPIDLLTEYVQAREYLSRSELGHSVLLQAEDGRNDVGRRFSIELEDARSSANTARRKYIIPPGNSVEHRIRRSTEFYGGGDEFQPVPLNCLPSGVRWNPRGALMTASGKALSPAIILAHELIHALHAIDGRFTFFRAVLSKLPQFTNVEELRTLRLERRLARDLGEGVRQAHNEGVRFPVESVTAEGGRTYPEIISDANVDVLRKLAHSTAHPAMPLREEKVFSGEAGALPLGPMGDRSNLRMIVVKSYDGQKFIPILTDRMLRIRETQT